MGISSTVDEQNYWAEVAREWYLKASKLSPETGRLYHHLPVVTSNPLDKLFFYHKSLSVSEPFLAGKAGMSSYLSSILSEGTRLGLRTAAIYIRLHVK